MSSIRKTATFTAVCTLLAAAPLSLATSVPSFAKHKKHHGAMAKSSHMKTPPRSEMKTTSPESKQTPSGGQPAGPAGKS